MAKKKIESATEAGSRPKANPGGGSSEAPGERSPAALSRDDVIEIAAENARLRRTLERVTDAVSDEDLDTAADALEDAGYRVDFGDDDRE